MNSHKSALVLGVTGKVGSRLAQALKADGWKVYGAARMSDPKKNEEIEALGIETIPFDVIKDTPADLPDVGAVFLEIWDPGKPELTWQINFYGVGRIIERYAGSAEAIVNGSTISTYGSSPEPSSEADFQRANTEYGQSRLAQERLLQYFCEKTATRAINVRYAHANSATQGVIRRTADSIRSRKSLGADPDARIQVIGIEDFVHVTKEALSRAAAPPAAVNCCHPHVWKKRELAEAIHQKLGEGEVIFDRDTGGLENSLYADVSRMIEWFGEPQTPVDTLIERVVADMKQ